MNSDIEVTEQTRNESWQGPSPVSCVAGSESPGEGSDIAGPRARKLHLKRREQDVDFFAILVDAVEAAVRAAILIGNVITVVGELFSGREAGGFADNLVALDDEPRSIRVKHDPLAAQQGDRVFRLVADRDEVHERVRLVRRQAGAAMVVAQFIETGDEAGNFTGAGHNTNRAGIHRAASIAWAKPEV
jgi:hypothetical protein